MGRRGVVTPLAGGRCGGDASIPYPGSPAPGFRPPSPRAQALRRNDGCARSLHLREPHSRIAVPVEREPLPLDSGPRLHEGRLCAGMTVARGVSICENPILASPFPWRGDPSPWIPAFAGIEYGWQGAPGAGMTVAQRASRRIGMTGVQRSPGTGMTVVQDRAVLAPSPIIPITRIPRITVQTFPPNYPLFTIHYSLSTNSVFGSSLLGSTKGTRTTSASTMPSFGSTDLDAGAAAPVGSGA